MNKFHLTRRHWISTLPFSAVAGSLKKNTQSDPETRFSQLTADQSPVLGVCHLGFLPNGRKRIIVRGPVEDGEKVTLLTPDGKTQTLDFGPGAAYDLGSGSI